MTLYAILGGIALGLILVGLLLYGMPCALTRHALHDVVSYGYWPGPQAAERQCNCGRLSVRWVKPVHAREPGPDGQPSLGAWSLPVRSQRDVLGDVLS